MPQSPWSDWHRGLRQSTLRPFPSSAKTNLSSLEWMRITLPATIDTCTLRANMAHRQGDLLHPDRHLTERPRLPVTSQSCPDNFPPQWLALLRRCRWWQTLSVPALVGPSFSTNLRRQSPRPTFLLESLPVLVLHRRQLPSSSVRQKVMSATQPLFWCPEASGGLRLVLATPSSSSPLHLVTLAPSPRYPLFSYRAVWVSGRTTLAVAGSRCAEQMTLGNPLLDTRTTDIAALGLLYIE